MKLRDTAIGIQQVIVLASPWLIWFVIASFAPCSCMIGCSQQSIPIRCVK